MVAVANEVHVAHLHQVDRGDRFAAPNHRGELLPPTPRPARQWPEAPVELTPAVERTDDPLQRHHPGPDPPLAEVPEGSDHLLVAEDLARISTRSAPKHEPSQPASEGGHRGASAGLQEVVLGIDISQPRRAGTG
jgi:hypothetical protein